LLRLPEPSYVALRVRAHAQASPWWESALRAAHTAPPAMRSILAGRSRVELSPSEASEAIAWACGLEGWDYGLAPVYVYRHPIPRRNEVRGVGDAGA
jgi:hypothetical protein